MKRNSRVTQKLRVTLLLTTCLLLLGSGRAFCESGQKTMIDPRDVYLDLEGLCGCEGMPYEYTTPPKEHIKTKINEKDIYLDMEALCGCEGMPYRYLHLPANYIKVKHDPEDLDLDVEKMLSEDPSDLK